MILKNLCVSIRVYFPIGHKGSQRYSIKIPANRQSPQRVPNRTAGGTWSEIPKLLTFEAHDKINKYFSCFGMRSPAQERYRIGAHRSPSDHIIVPQSRSPLPIRDSLTLGAAVKIDAHAGSSFSICDISRYFCSGVTEIS